MYLVGYKSRYFFDLLLVKLDCLFCHNAPQRPRYAAVTTNGVTDRHIDCVCPAWVSLSEDSEYILEGESPLQASW